MKRFEDLGFELGFIGRYPVEINGKQPIIIKGVDFDRIIDKFPIVAKLAEAVTTSHWHMEGDMLTHTKMVTNEMVIACMGGFMNSKYDIDPEIVTIMILSAVFHDIGKVGCKTDEKGRLLSHGHPKKSAEIVKDMFKEYKNCDILAELVLWHDLYCEPKISDRKLRLKIGSFSDFLIQNIYMLITLFNCDDRGAIHEPNDNAKIMSERVAGFAEEILRERLSETIRETRNILQRLTDTN